MAGSMEALAKLATPHRRWLFVIMLVGAVLRVIVNDVAAYSPPDEAHYVDITRWLTRDGLSAYPELVSTYLDRHAMWLSPTPLRWGYFTLTTLGCSVSSTCDGRTIAWLSTLAGIVSMLLTYLLGKRLVGAAAALIATAFTICSPLQLGLGRRALQDEVYTAAFLAAFLALVRLLDSDPHEPRAVTYQRWAGFLAASTFAFAVKEAFVFPYAAFAAIFAIVSRGVRWRDLALFTAPPVLFCTGFVALGRNPGALFELIRLNEASFSSDYSIQYQSGPAHRPLFDLFLLAPIVCVLATAALAKMTERLREAGRERWLAGFLIMTLGSFMSLPKNLRFVVILDPVLRLLAAWLVCNHAWVARASRLAQSALVASIVVINAAVEFSLFETIFRRRNIYDPTTYDILLALGAIPRSLAGAETNRFPVAFFLGLGGVVAIVLGVRRSAMTEMKEGTEGSTPSRLGTPVIVGIGVVSLVAAFFAGRMSSRDAALGSAPDKPAMTNVSGQNVAPPRDAMAEGLHALYTQKDAAKAVARFREVLTAQPSHYGATYQLATALEQAGDATAARATWGTMQAMAEAGQDEATAAHARARLAALNPPPAPVAQPDDGTAEPMRLGLAALYEKNDAATAAKHFREVLAKNPQHYGATFQLATALDKAGKRDEAKPIWSKVAEMADANGDKESANAARKRLGNEKVFGGFN